MSLSGSTDGGILRRKPSPYLSADLTEALIGQSRRQFLTLNTFIQAAWALLLGSLTGRDDVVSASSWLRTAQPSCLNLWKAWSGCLSIRCHYVTHLRRGEQLHQLLARLAGAAEAAHRAPNT